jgi:hypothetical protein
VPIERGSGCEGRLEMANGFPFISLGLIYLAENLMELTDEVFLAFIYDEIDCAGCGALRGVVFFVVKQ